MMSAAYGPPSTPDSMSNGLMSGEALDENGLYQRATGWPAIPTATPLRTFTKVGILTSVLPKSPDSIKNLTFLQGVLSNQLAPV